MPLGWAAVNNQPTSCAACRPECNTPTQSQSRVNLDQTAGPGIDDTLATNSLTDGPTLRRRPADDMSDRETRPEAEA